jgi:hypothetical protein
MPAENGSGSRAARGRAPPVRQKQSAGPAATQGIPEDRARRTAQTRRPQAFRQRRWSARSTIGEASSAPPPQATRGAGRSLQGVRQARRSARRVRPVVRDSLDDEQDPSVGSSDHRHRRERAAPHGTLPVIRATTHVEGKAIGSSRRRTPAARLEQARAGPALGALASGRKRAQGRHRFDAGGCGVSARRPLRHV